MKTWCCNISNIFCFLYNLHSCNVVCVANEWNGTVKYERKKNRWQFKCLLYWQNLLPGRTQVNILSPIPPGKIRPVKNRENSPPPKPGKSTLGTRLQTLTSKWPRMFNDVSENHFKPGINLNVILPHLHYCIHMQINILFLESTFYLRGVVRG